VTPSNVMLYRLYRQLGLIQEKEIFFTILGSVAHKVIVLISCGYVYYIFNYKRALCTLTVFLHFFVEIQVCLQHFGLLS